MVIPAGEVTFNRGWITDNQLPHTCTIIRRTQDGQTPYEEPIYIWATHASGVKCRFWDRPAPGSGQTSDDRRTVLVYEHRLKLAAGTDITEDDLIDDVVNQLGEPMHLARLKITAIWKRTHETVCRLEKVK